MNKDKIINLLFATTLVSLVLVFLSSIHVSYLAVDGGEGRGFPYAFSIKGSVVSKEDYPPSRYFSPEDFVFDFLFYAVTLCVLYLALLGAMKGSIWLTRKSKISGIQFIYKQTVNRYEFGNIIFLITAVSLVYLFVNLRGFPYKFIERTNPYWTSYDDFRFGYFILDFLFCAGALGIFYLIFRGICEGVIALIKKLKAVVTNWNGIILRSWKYKTSPFVVLSFFCLLVGFIMVAFVEGIGLDIGQFFSLIFFYVYQILFALGTLCALIEILKGPGSTIVLLLLMMSNAFLLILLFVYHYWDHY